MWGLKYFDGAIPGKKVKKQNGEEKKKEYEKHRKERQFNEKWKEGRPWLEYLVDETNMASMTCKYCIDYEGVSRSQNNTKTFIKGCKNWRLSAVTDHEKSNFHMRACDSVKSKSVSTLEKKETEAGRTLLSLQKADITRLQSLFRNAHAVVKNNRPLRDYVWLCELDKAKGIDVGETYLNDKAAIIFTTAIAESERKKTVESVATSNFYAVMMDGSTDISGDEQETLYIRLAHKGEIKEKFVCIGTPYSTAAEDLKTFVLNSLHENGINKDKLVALGSDGASNMTGVKGDLAALLRRDVNPELVNVHCFAHRLELAFRDVLKKKEHRGNGPLPTKVTGTRWLAHLSRGIKSLLRTYLAYEAHLSTLSHSNPKAEGYLKMLLSKDLVCFTLFLQEALLPLMTLSLKLQRPNSNLAASLEWAHGTMDIIEDLKMSEFTQAREVLETGEYKGIKLRGNATLSYISSTLDGFQNSLRQRFDQSEVLKCTRITQLKNWPTVESLLAD